MSEWQTSMVLTQAQSDQLGATILAPGIRVWDNVRKRLFMGDGATAGGVAVGAGGAPILSAYGSLTPAASASTTIVSAATAVGTGPLLVDAPAALPTDQVVQGPDYYGAQPIYSPSTKKTSRNTGTGNQVSNLPGRGSDLFAWGMETLGPAFYDKLENRQPIKIGLVGDSNMEFYFGVEFLELLRGLPNVTVQNCGHSGTTMRQSLDNTGGINGTGHRWSAIIASGYDLIVDGYGGTNDPSFGGTPASFEADKREAYNLLRASRTSQQTAVLVLSAAMQNDGVDGRDELFSFRARNILQKLCKEYGFAFADKLGRFPDAFVDVLNLGARNTNLDENRVHTAIWLSKALAETIFADVIPPQYRASLVTSYTGTHTLMYGANSPALYPRGVSILRTGDSGFPYDGFVCTINTVDGFAFQINYGYGGQTAIALRIGNGFTAWGSWFTLGGGASGTQFITPASGYSFAGLTDKQKAAVTPAGGATLLKGTIVKTTPAPLTFGNSIGTIPAGSRPDETITVPITAYVGSATETLQLQLGNDGTMLILTGSTIGNVDKVVIPQVIFRN